jgi:hypothetical protein
VKNRSFLAILLELKHNKAESWNDKMGYTTLMSRLECMPQLKEADAQSLYATFEQIQDGRCKRGIRYLLALL